MKKHLLIQRVFILFLVILFSCKSELPVVKTVEISNISHNAAISGGELLESGSDPVVTIGICWNTASNPTIKNFKTSDTLVNGVFVSRLTQLALGTTYYVRAYAQSEAGIGYGEQISFQTLSEEIINITTVNTSSITSTSVTSGGNIAFSGNINERGVVWSTSLNPNTSNNKVQSGTGSGNFESTITGLSPKTTYYLKAYAITNNGTFYGNEISFTTLTTTPVVTTAAIWGITKTSAWSGGTVTNNEGLPILSHGICWNTSENPTISNNKTVEGSGVGNFTSYMAGLKSDTKYYVRAYATTLEVTTYGSQLVFTTIEDIPITTTAASSITNTTAATGGNIAYSGTVSERGVAWGYSENPTVNLNKVTAGSGSGQFTVTLTGLTPNLMHFARAYAVVNENIHYGNQISLLTNPSPPTVTTSTAYEITETSVKCQGNISSPYGNTITARGICWSISENPTVNNSKTDHGPGETGFTSTLTGLTPGTKYYARAYATTNSGTTYGNQISFTTYSSLTLTTTPATNVSPVLGITGGSIIYSGPVTERGVVWSISSNPTLSDNKITSGTGSGTYSCSMTGLTPNTKYFVKAYAINNYGTHYGNEITFTTLIQPELPVVTTSPVNAIYPSSAQSGGNVTSDGGSAVTSRGVCWSTNPGPTINNNKITSGSGLGSFTTTSYSLTGNTTYYLRAFATNNVGTAYGNEYSFSIPLSLPGPQVTDIDGNNYTSVRIGNQTWLVQNLKTTRYQNGDLIGTTTPATLDITSETNPKYQWAPDNNESNVAIYGRLYSWYACADSRNICPVGWKVPELYDWFDILQFLGGSFTSGGKLKKVGTDLWIDNVGATNETGFTAVPAGYRSPNGQFTGIGLTGQLWTTTEFASGNGWKIRMRNSDIKCEWEVGYNRYGHSVRCLKIE